MKNLYLINLSSYRILNEKIKELSKEYDEVVNLNLADILIDDILVEASYQGMFSSNKIVIVKNCKYFGEKFLYEDDMNKLTNFLKNADNYSIVFICNELSKGKTNTKNVIALGAKVITDSDIKDEAKEEIFNNYLKDNNITIDSNALELLKKNTLDNFDLLLSEIEKLSLVDSKITKEIVETYSCVEEEDRFLEFSNAITDRNFKKSFDLLEILIKNNTPTEAIIGIIANSFANIYMVKDAVSRGVSDEEIASVLGYKNPNRVYYVKKNGKYYTLEDLKDIIINLSNLDRKIKTGYPPVSGIKEFILSL